MGEGGGHRPPADARAKRLALALIRWTTPRTSWPASCSGRRSCCRPVKFTGRTTCRLFADLFQQGFIYDWNTCDWFSCVCWVRWPAARATVLMRSWLAHGPVVVATPRGGCGLSISPSTARPIPRLHGHAVRYLCAARGVPRALRPDRRRLGAARLSLAEPVRVVRFPGGAGQSIHG